MPLKVYDRTLAVLRRAVDQARLGNDEKLAALRRLDAEARRLEAVAEGPDFGTFVEEERRRSPEFGGMSVFGPARPPPPLQAPAHRVRTAHRPRPAPAGQLSLPGLDRRRRP